MKILTAIAALLFTAQVWACPDMAGNYVCTSAEGEDQGNFAITQREENGVTIYQMGEEEYIADGKEHAVSQDGFEGKYVAVCGQNNLVADIAGVYDGQVTVEVKATATKLGSGDVELTGKGKITYDGVVDNIDDKSTCKKQN